MGNPFSLPDDAIERRWVWCIIAAMLLAISLPYLWVRAITPAELEFQWILYNPDDQNVHLAWAKQAAQGHFFFRDLFTTESLTSNERPLFNNFFLWIVGALSLGDRIPIIAIFHALRLLFTALTLWWFHSLTTRLTDDRRIRVLALFFAAFAMGPGWIRNAFPALFSSLRVADNPTQANFAMMPEAFTFSSAFIFPLFMASIAMLALVYLQVLRAQETGSMRHAIVAGIAALFLANFHTYDAIPLNLTMLLWAGYSAWLQKGSEQKTRMAWMAPLIAVLGTLPPFFYQIYVFRNSTEFQLKARTPTPPPDIIEMLLSYAPLVLFVIPGVFVAWRRPGLRLMLLWLTVALIVIYAPLSFGRKMIEGAHLPLCFLGAAGLIKLFQTARVRRGVVICVALLCSFSSLFFVSWCVENAMDNNNSRLSVLMPPLSLRTGDAGALRFLNQPQYRDQKAVLCLNLLGNYVPRATGKFAYIGHWAETLNFQKEKLPRALAFYRGTMTPDEASQWLRENHIGYVVNGYYEKGILRRPGRPSLPQQMGWAPIYNEDGTTVYRVPEERNPNQ
jgi:hypothetical protein